MAFVDILVEGRTLDEYPQYVIYEDGTVYSRYMREYLKAGVIPPGYKRVTINARSMFVHKLVALAFIPNPNNFPFVDHIDANKLNNNAKNLEWVLPTENSLRAIRNGRKIYTRQVYQYTFDGKLVKVHNSIDAASKETKVTRQAISQALKAKSHKCKGYLWFPTKKFVKPPPPKRGKSVMQIDKKTKEVIRIFDNQTQAARELGILSGGISDVCNGITKTCGGYEWKAVEKEPKVDVKKEWHDWLVVPEFPTYRASRDGRIFSITQKKELKFFDGGYKRVILSQNHQKIHMQVHRVIALTYIPNPENYPMVNHKNGNKVDNRVENLEWTTDSGNVRHAYKMGLISRTRRKGYKMLRHYSSAIRVGAFDNDGNCIKKFVSAKAAAREYGIDSRTVLKMSKIDKSFAEVIWKRI